jgi:lipid-A-disaccharide synthase
MKMIRFEAPVFFCAGEPSGDLYAGSFISQLKKEDPNTGVTGVGGLRMKESGAVSLFHYDKLKTFGLSGGLGALLDNYYMYRKIGRRMLALRPRTFVAVAYPGLNLMLCRVARAHGIKVYYLLPPQIWAWGTFRKYFMKKWVDRVVSVFPFEAEFYQRLGIDTILVENPLIEILRGYERTDSKRRIGFMPGSRDAHFRRNLPVVRRIIDLIRARNENIECCIIAYGAKDKRNLSDLNAGSVIYYEDRYQMMKNCDLLVTCSGTASLEACLLEVPQIFFHRPSLVDFHVFQRALKLSEYNLCNILHRRQIVPSFVHHNVNILVDRVYRRIDFSMLDPGR